MFDRVDAFQRSPILKPNYLYVISHDLILGCLAYPILRHLLDKGRFNKVINELPSLGGKVVRCWIILQVEFCPDHQVHNPEVKPVRPIVVQNLIATCGRSAVKIQNISLDRDILGSLNNMLGFVNPSCQPSLSWRTNAMTEPYSFLSLALYSIYLRKSDGTRWRRSILLSSCKVRGKPFTRGTAFTYDLLDFSPGQPVILGIWSGKNASILRICIC